MAIPKPDTTTVTPETERIACDGGGEAGHPRVWYSFENKNEVVCGYCGRAYVKAGAHGG